MTAQVQRLSNNIPVIVEEIPGARSVTFGIYVGSGSANETKENNGIAHALEHMLFKGTKRHTAAELADIMTELGDGVNAYTSKENTVFYAKVLPEDFSRAAALVAELMTESLLLQKEFNKEKHVILDEIDAYDDSAEDMCHELLQKLVWKDNPFGYIIPGTRTNVKGFGRQQLVDFLRDNYTADNMVISVAGHCRPKETAAVLEPLFAQFPAAGNKRIAPKPEFHRCFVTRCKDMGQVHLNIAFDNVSNADKGRYAMYMVNSLLGGNLNSRLFQKVREENGLTYSIYSYNSMCDTAGLFHIYASMGAGQTKKVAELIFKILEEFSRDGISGDELERVKKQTRTELILGSETAAGTVLNNARTFVTAGRVISLDEALENYNAVTAEEMNRYIRTYLRTDKCSVCLVGNIKEVPVAELKTKWKRKMGGFDNERLQD